MRRISPRRSLVPAIVMAIPAAFLVWRFASDLGPLPDTSSDNDAPIRAEGLRSFLVRENGMPLWSFSADTILVAPDGIYTEATGVHNAILYQNGQRYLTFSAPAIKLTNATNDLVATGGVIATGVNGFSFSAPIVEWDFRAHRINFPSPTRAKIHDLTFATSTIAYDMNTQQLTCPQTVSVTGPGLSIQGARVRADVRSRRIEVDGGAELNFDPKVVGIGAASVG